MYISKRSFVRIISYLTAVIVVVGILAAKGFNTSSTLKTQLEYNMARSVEDLSASIDNIKNTLEKGIYSGSPQMMSQLSSKLWSDASNAKTTLSQLPVSELHLENTYKFLSQVGNYSKSLADKYSAGEALSDKDRKNLAALSEYASTLSENMWRVEQRITDGELSFEKSQNAVQGADNNKEPSYITEGFTDFEEGYDNYPELIYDGPFSDHIMEKQPEMLKGANQISVEEALKKAEKAVGINGLSHNENNDEQGKMPSFVFTKDNATVSITKNGGYLSYMMNYRPVNSSDITANQAVTAAKDYLKGLGIENVTDTYYEIQGNVCTVNFAAEQDDVTMYTDLIKVSVAMDNGSVVGFDARGYITNHRQRSIGAPKISKSQAAANISKSLTVDKVKLAVIPSSGTNERYCYEFSCRTEKGNEVLVYVNADSGKEEQILLLKISENGTLTV